MQFRAKARLARRAWLAAAPRQPAPADHFALGPALPGLAAGLSAGVTASLAAGGASTVANRRAMPDRPAASFAGAGLSSPSPRLENFDLPSRSPMALPAVCVERGL